VRVFAPVDHGVHAPSLDYSDGLPPFPHLEAPERVERILEGIGDAGTPAVTWVEGEAEAAVRALHDADYVDFLLALAETLEPGQEYLPPVFRGDLSTAPLALRGGMYCTEIGTPLGAGSVRAGLNSARVAVEAARAVRASGGDAWALCRPPGHHAGRRRYGGYCLFNNAYLAVAELVPAGRCPVLDLDYHIGDGSIEFAHAAAPYYSLHADPWRNYPYLDAGLDLAAPAIRLESLAPGTRGAEYVERVRALIAAIDGEGCAALVLSLGFDTLGSDYIQDELIGLEPEDFRAVGAAVGGLRAPVLVLQEGGYDIERLRACAGAFADGLLRARARARP
jgi:acetoin utilization deacetylase AcuC-like enzyme